MKNRKSKIISVVIFFTLNSQLLTLNSILVAEPFNIIGARPLGLAGSFTAIAEDSLAGYWNPAGLYTQKGFDIQLPTIGLGAEFTGNLLSLAYDLKQTAESYSQIQNAQTQGSYITLQQLQSFSTSIKKLNELNAPNIGVLADISGGVGVRIGKISISVNNYTYIGLDPDIKLYGLWLGSSSPCGIDFSGISSTNTPSGIDSNTINDLSGFIDLIITEAGVSSGTFTSTQIANALINYAQNQSVSNNDIIQAIQTIKENQDLIQQLLKNPNLSAFMNNQSNVTLRGLSVVEVSLGYSMLCPYVQQIHLLKGLTLGGNIKYIYGLAGYIKQKLLTGEVSESGTIVSDFNKNLKDSSQIGIDLGILWDKRNEYRTKVGIVARNINSPKFESPEEARNTDEEFKLSPQVRFGVGFWPLSWITISSDIDLTKNSTFVPGYYSQMVSLGSELNILNKSWLNLALRAGLKKNVAVSNSKLTYTAGFGLNILHFVIDISGTLSSDQTEIERGTKIPANVSAAASFSLNF